MQFSGLFLTANRKYSISLSTPTPSAPTTITIKSSLGEMSVTGHIISWAHLEREMISLARIVGANEDDHIVALAKQLGGRR
jgi:hypothetical protein